MRGSQGRAWRILPFGIGLLGALAGAGRASAAPKPKLTIDNVSTTEGNAGTQPFVFSVQLSAASTQTVTVNYATANGTAAAPGDYTTTSGTLTFNPGVTVQTITVLVNGDLLNETNETFTVRLSKGKNAVVQRAIGTGTIVNDDAVPSLSIGDASVSEGDSGAVPATFAVNLSAASGTTVTVNYSTQDQSAAAGVDYAAQNGTVTFAPGTTTQQIAISVFGDIRDESTETFLVDLAGPVNAIINDSQAVGTILDDDPVPALTIGDVTVIEGNAGTTTAAFAVSLSIASGLTVSVAFATADGTATVAGNDYQAQSGTLTFTPGTSTLTVNVLVNGDATAEPNETFLVNLSAPTNASLADAQGLGTIVDNEGPPALFIDDVTAAEGNSGPTTFTFTVALTVASASPASVDYATADGTATVANGDYQAASGSVTFQPGETSHTVAVTVNGDTLNEADESFVVNLLNPSGATVGRAQGTGTIQNDDPAPLLSISDVSVVERNTGTQPAVFNVTLGAPSNQTVTVNFASNNGTASASDYTPVSGSLTFAPGTVAQTITVQVAGDVLNEANETYTVTLTNPANAGLAKAIGTGSIVNDDPLPSLSIDNVNVAEGDVQTNDATFTLNLASVSGQTVTVNFATANGTATGNDYAAQNGTLTFPPGTLSQTLNIAVNGDTSVEPNETFLLNLSQPVNVTLATPSVTGTILNDDGTTIDVGDVTLAEGNTGTTPFAFEISLSQAGSGAITVSYATADGTATVAGGDYLSASNSVTFAPGEDLRTVIVSVNGDTLLEGDETFVLNLTGVTGNATVFNSLGTATVLNEDGTATDLSVTKTDFQSHARPGDTLVYTIVASNTGPSPALGATVTDVLPAALTGATWTCLGAGGATCTASGSGNINDIVNLPVGATVTYTLTGIVSVNPTNLVNTATIFPGAGAGDPDFTNNSATDIDVLACFGEIVIVPDGRLTNVTIGANSTVWFGSSLKIGDSYSLELTSLIGTGVSPGTLTLFKGDDGCGSTSTLVVRDTTAIDPGSASGSLRVSFGATGTQSFFRARLVNSSGIPIPASLGIADTTLYSPAWSTNGSFDTFYSFQNTTTAAMTGTLTLLSTSGTVLGTYSIAVPAGQTVSANTFGLGATRNQTGTARFTHDGPPGAIVAEAAVANFSLSPAYVQPVKFVATREAR